MLVVPTDGYRAVAFLEAAARLGVDVVVATDESPPLAAAMEDRLVVVDLDRPADSAARIAAATGRHPVDAVVAVDDQGVLTAAHASELLGIAHNPPDAVAATRDKVEMRSVLASWQVPQPTFGVALRGDDIAALARHVGLPCVIKPVSLSASIGVIRADTPEEAVETANRVRRILGTHGRSPDEPLLVERFVPGPEVALEGLVRGGNLEVLALFDKPDPLDGPYFEETIYVTPSGLSHAEQARVIGSAQAGCRALGLSDGPVHAELRVARDGAGGSPRAVVIEIAARSIGGRCSRALRFGVDSSLEELILRDALGIGVGDLDPVGAASGVMMLPIPRSGLLADIAGLEAARAVSGVVDVEITAARGLPIRALPEGGRYLGFVFAVGDTPARVCSALRAAHSALEVTITDEPAGRPPNGGTDPHTTLSEVGIGSCPR